MTLPVGARLGPYAIEAPIGAGGMGEVYRARDTRLDRIVAIKVLSAHSEGERQSQERFLREARTVSSLEHAHICALYDVGESDGRAFIVMQYLEGATLTERLEKGALPPEQALRIAIEICDALDVAHRHGIVHRDVKPSNIMLTASGAKLLDFGLATQRPAVSLADGGKALEKLTEEGTIVGTLHYMPPEQICGDPTNARSDIYAFGAVLYEMFAGHPPFEARDPASLIGAILTQEAPPLPTASLGNRRVERAIRVCLEKEPDQRWQSARDLLRELRWIVEERSGANGRAADAPVVPSWRTAVTSRRTLIAVAATAIVVAGLSWTAWAREPAATLPARPIVLMMDSPHPERVYDPATLRAGGTNADDLNDLLGDLPLSLVKETTGSTWHRETQMLSQNADIVLVHRSCFYDATLLDVDSLNTKYWAELYGPAADKLEALVGYLALGNTRTRFIVYSRGSWESDSAVRVWTEAMVRRYPQLAGRLVAYKVPLHRATFRNAETSAEIRALALRELRAMGRLDD